MAKEKKFPGLFEQFKNLTNLTLTTTQKVLVDGENPIISDEEYERRLSICNDCESFEKSSKRCSLCGCFMSTKAKLSTANCPALKWEIPKTTTQNS